MRSVLALLLLVVACGKNTEPPPPSSGSPMAPRESGPSGMRGGGPAGTGGPATPGPAMPGPAVAGVPEKAQQMFATVCATCHGIDGKGDGPVAEKLDPKPRNYTDAAWQASVTDDELKKTILKGGQAVGKSPMMPGNPQLEQQPEILDGLIKIIRGFKQ